MGVATDCSTVWASAPTYVVLMTISGGTMFGYWAIGRPRMATTPTMTMMMEMTMATMGRLMKNLDMAAYLFSGLRWASGFGPAFWDASGLPRPERLPQAWHRVGLKGLRATAIPSRTFWIPSATTLSPAFKPSSITQS